MNSMGILLSVEMKIALPDEISVSGYENAVKTGHVFGDMESLFKDSGVQSLCFGRRDRPLVRGLYFGTRSLDRSKRGWGIVFDRVFPFL